MPALAEGITDEDNGRHGREGGFMDITGSLGNSPNNCWGRGGPGGGGMDRIKAHNSRLKLDPRNPVYLFMGCCLRRQADTALDTQAITSGLLYTIRN